MPNEHTITLDSDASPGVRIACQMGLMSLRMMQPDDRMTVLVSLLVSQIDAVTESEEEIDAIIDMIRMRLRLMKTPPSQLFTSSLP
jgi:hypothetical protein